MIRLELPWPPSANKQHGQRGTRRYSTKAVTAYRKTVAAICMMERVKPLEGELICVLRLYPSKRSRLDADNSLKVLIDAIVKAGCMKNDRQIKTFFIDTQYGNKGKPFLVCILSKRTIGQQIMLTVGKTVSFWPSGATT